MTESIKIYKATRVSHKLTEKEIEKLAKDESIINALLLEGWNYVILVNGKHMGVNELPGYINEPSSFRNIFWVLDKNSKLTVQSSYDRIPESSEIGCLVL